MPLPREVLPGRTYMFTRRCSQRQFLMRPDAATNNAFIYCLGVAAERAGVVVLFTSAQSNHHHTGIFDPTGTYPDFLEHFHKLFAKCMNSHRGRWENFWSSEQTSVLRLVTPDDVMAKMAYALSNPAKDDLVDSAEDWPGINAFHAIVHRQSLTVTRPEHFFRENGPMPKTVTVSFARPPGFDSMSHDEFVALLTHDVRAIEAEARARRASAGRQVTGAAAVLAQDWRARPRSHEPRHNLDPRIAAKEKWSRIEALLRSKDFIHAYRASFTDLKRGIKDVLFPAGTYWLRRFAGVLCAPAQVTYPASAG